MQRVGVGGGKKRKGAQTIVGLTSIPFSTIRRRYVVQSTEMGHHSTPLSARSFGRQRTPTVNQNMLDDIKSTSTDILISYGFLYIQVF